MILTNIPISEESHSLHPNQIDNEIQENKEKTIDKKSFASQDKENEGTILETNAKLKKATESTDVKINVSHNTQNLPLTIPQTGSNMGKKLFKEELI